MACAPLPSGAHPESAFSPRTGGPAGGFTLLELLVVISVIGVLAALVLPAGVAAKGFTYRTLCASQLRQNGMGFHRYLDDHNQTLPYAIERAPGLEISWDDHLHEYLGGADLSSGQMAADHIPAELGTPMLTCPEDPADEAYAGRATRTYAMVGDRAVAGDRGVGIAMNHYDWLRPEQIRADGADVPAPMRTFLLTEHARGARPADAGVTPNVQGGTDHAMISGPGAQAADEGGDDIPSLHGSATERVANFLYVDGAVKLEPIFGTLGSGTAETPGGAWTRDPND